MSPLTREQLLHAIEDFCAQFIVDLDLHEVGDQFGLDLEVIKDVIEDVVIECEGEREVIDPNLVLCKYRLTPQELILMRLLAQTRKVYREAVGDGDGLYDACMSLMRESVLLACVRTEESS